MPTEQMPLVLPAEGQPALLRAVLEGVPIQPGVKGFDRRQQMFARSMDQVELFANHWLGQLTAEQRKTAFVRVFIIEERPLREIRPEGVA